MDKRKKGLNELALHIDVQLKQLYGKEMGFYLICSPLGDSEKRADYIGNCTRESATEWLLETVERWLDKGDDNVDKRSLE